MLRHFAQNFSRGGPLVSLKTALNGVLNGALYSSSAEKDGQVLNMLRIVKIIRRKNPYLVSRISYLVKPNILKKNFFLVRHCDQARWFFAKYDFIDFAVFGLRDTRYASRDTIF